MNQRQNLMIPFRINLSKQNTKTTAVYNLHRIARSLTEFFDTDTAIKRAINSIELFGKTINLQFAEK